MPIVYAEPVWDPLGATITLQTGKLYNFDLAPPVAVCVARNNALETPRTSDLNFRWTDAIMRHDLDGRSEYGPFHGIRLELTRSRGEHPYIHDTRLIGRPTHAHEGIELHGLSWCERKNGSADTWAPPKIIITGADYVSEEDQHLHHTHQELHDFKAEMYRMWHQLSINIHPDDEDAHPSAQFLVDHRKDYLAGRL